MEFFFLFILNIFTGAVIYLILSLRMERTTSTFHEQKLRKEMGEIITEFNSTAERNITLLENRINMLKRLMGEQGNLKGIDFKIDDEVTFSSPAENNKLKKKHLGDQPDIKNIRNDLMLKKNNSVKTDADNSMLVGFIDKISNLSNLDTITATERDTYTSEKKEITVKSKSADRTGLNKVDIFSDYTEEINEYIEEKEIINEDLGVLFSSTGDKYALIGELYKKGYTVDDISKYSGLPSGEVRLVISLNR